MSLGFEDHWTLCLSVMYSEEDVIVLFESFSWMEATNLVYYGNLWSMK